MESNSIAQYKSHGPYLPVCPFSFSLRSFVTFFFLGPILAPLKRLHHRHHSTVERLLKATIMTSPSTISPKFLSADNDLGVIAVGFSGGQVKSPVSVPMLYKRPPTPPLQRLNISLLPLQKCKPGVDAAPTALISAGLLTQLKEDLGYNLHHDDKVHNYSNLMPSSDPDYRNMKNPLAVSAVTKQLSDQVYDHAKRGRLVLTLGGDHSIAIGTVAGTSRAIKERLGREMAVIWVDAHADINTPETSESGNIHGMPVAFLTGLAKEENPGIFGWLGEEKALSLKKLVYIGLRDIDRGEKKILREHGIKAFSMHDIDKYGFPSLRLATKVLNRFDFGP